MIHVPGKHYWCTWVREFMDGRQKAAENVWGAAQSKMKSNSLNRYFIIFKMFWNYDWLWCHTKTTTTTTAHSLCRRMTHLHLFSIKKVWIARKPKTVYIKKMPETKRNRVFVGKISKKRKKRLCDSWTQIVEMTQYYTEWNWASSIVTTICNANKFKNKF